MVELINSEESGKFFHLPGSGKFLKKTYLVLFKMVVIIQIVIVGLFKIVIIIQNINFL
jgi:hypothetical protein